MPAASLTRDYQSSILPTDSAEDPGNLDRSSDLTPPPRHSIIPGMVAATPTTTTTYRYRFLVGTRVVHQGITTDLERRQREHRRRWPGGRIEAVGGPTSHAEAWEWERQQATALTAAVHGLELPLDGQGGRHGSATHFTSARFQHRPGWLIYPTILSVIRPCGFDGYQCQSSRPRVSSVLADLVGILAGPRSFMDFRTRPR